MNNIKLRAVDAIGATPKEFEASFDFKPLIDFDHPDIIGNIPPSERSNAFELNKPLENGCVYYVQGTKQNAEDEFNLFSCILDLSNVKSLDIHRGFSSIFKEYENDTLLCFYADSYNYLFPYDGVGGEDIPYDILHGYTIKLYKVNLETKTPEIENNVVSPFKFDANNIPTIYLEKGNNHNDIDISDINYKVFRLCYEPDEYHKSQRVHIKNKVVILSRLSQSQDIFMGFTINDYYLSGESHNIIESHFELNGNSGSSVILVVCDDVVFITQCDCEI